MKKSMGATIADFRKEKGMTQAQLAEQMGITDKAVSKWERDLSCPDIGSIPKLAELLGISVEQLIQGEPSPAAKKQNTQELVGLIFRTVALAMGIAVTVLTVLNRLDVRSGMSMLGIGLACVAGYLLQNRK